MKKNVFIPLFFLLIVISQTLFSQTLNLKNNKDNMVTSTTKIFLPDYPDAHNPSLVDTDQGLLLTFRWLPNLETPWISYIGVVFLNELLQPISKPQLLNVRLGNKTIPSQSEDARIFYYQDNLYLIYNDNHSLVNPSFMQRRDMYIAQISYVNNQFVVSAPLKIHHQKKYISTKWQKNWVPFVWDNALLLSYSIIPHEVLYSDGISGECIPFTTTPFANPNWHWEWGHLRGGTPAILVDDEYLAFFHSSIVIGSPATNGVPMHHYFMGAYTFSAEPPFEITAISLTPIIADGFYTQSSYSKRVIFPGGFVVRDRYLYLAYGKDDQEIWIATINRKKLNKSLVPVSLLENKTQVK